MSRKHLTVEAERWCLERIAQHNDNIDGWREPDGPLIPTEPCPEERVRIRVALKAAREELLRLLVTYCGADELRLLDASLLDDWPAINFVETSNEAEALNSQGTATPCERGNEALLENSEGEKGKVSPAVTKALSAYHNGRKIVEENASLQGRLAEIAAILERVENRCQAVDGPVSRPKEEITVQEYRRIYLLASGRAGT